MSAVPNPTQRALITELVIQGVRRFGDVRRFTFGSGYNVLYGLPSGGKSTIFDVLRSLLFANDPAENEAESFRSTLPAGQAACRAGITLSLGPETFRLLKDYQQGSVTLSRLTPDRRFELILSDAPTIQRWLSEHAGFAIGPDFARVFTLSRKEFPSTLEGAFPVASVDETFEERLRAMSLPEKQQLLAQLSDEYRRHAETKTTEFLQDGLRHKLFEVDTLIKKRDETKEKLAELEIELAPIEKVPKLPDGFEERADAYNRQAKQRESELADLHARQADAHARLEATIPAPFTEKDMRATRDPVEMVKMLLTKDFQLDGGIAGALVGVVMATFLGRPLNLLGVLVLAAGVGMIAYRGLFVFLKAKESFDGLRREVDQIDEQVKVIEKKWDIETTVVRNLMKAYNAEDPDEMRQIERRRDAMVAQRQELLGRIAAIQLPSGEDIDQAKAKLQRQIESLDRRLQEIGGEVTVDPKDLEPQIERLDREVARAEGRKRTPRAKLFAREEDVQAAAAEEAAAGDAMTSVLEAWCKANDADLNAVLRGLQEGFSRNLRAISGGRFSGGAFDADGGLTMYEEGKAGTPYESLDGMAKDSAYLALRLTLFQLVARGPARVLALLDDPFDFEEGRLAVVARALKALGADAQIFHFTSRPAVSRLAHHTAEI